jgi:D-3-phosphoglycerate dehydrogenase
MQFSPYFALLRYEDRPGIVGIVGSLMGEANVNIANMQVSRQSEGGEALMCLAVDSPVPDHVLRNIADRVHARDARLIELHT